LSYVLEEFANKMALRTGGLSGIKKLIHSKAMGTIELSTGLQISGVFSNIIEFDGKPVYFQTQGKTALANREKELVGHGTNHHPEGFGSPIGKLKGINLAIEDMSPKDLKAYGIYEGENVTLEFEGEITVSGKIITGSRNLQGAIIIISLENCTVTHKDTILFSPEWGRYDMAVGKKVVSAFSGPADCNSFDLITHLPNSKTIKAIKTPEKEELESLYKEIRSMREGKTVIQKVNEIFATVSSKHRNDWLLPLEIAEILHREKADIPLKNVLNYLNNLKLKRPEVSNLIENGLGLFML
jgi:phenylalanine-4-hydroxylase